MSQKTNFAPKREGHPWLAAALAVAMAAAGPAAAQEAEDEPLVTDRPDFTESADTVAPGRFQLEGGVTFSEADEVEERSHGELLGRLGLLDWLELRIGVPSYVEVEAPGGFEASGWEDASLGVKAKLAAGGGGRPSAALLVATTLPTGSDELGGGDALQPEAVLALAWDLAPDLGLGANLGYAHPRDDGDRFHQLFASTALGWSATERLGLFAEVFGFSEEEDGGDATLYADGGATWLLSPDAQLDVRVGTGVSGTETDWFAGVGFAARW